MTGSETTQLATTSVDFELNCCSNQAEALFLREVAGKRLRHLARDRVPISGWSIDMLGELVGLIDASDGRADGPKSVLLRHDEDRITLVELFDSWANIATAGSKPREAESACHEIAETIRAPEDVDESITPITFWALDTDRDPRAMRREIETPEWSEMADNYSSSARSGMASLLQLDHSPDERMILWHGPPGTGKTHALRALAREWRSWCDVAFIADPEEFFGGSPTYLFDVARDRAGHPRAVAEQRSKLIVLEDAGELMTVEARRTTGQGLSRLLNLTDGLIGQGLKVMVLITTNEPLSVLHPAVIRPGRCLAEIEFGPLASDEANEWLAHRGSQVRVHGASTLADLFAILEGHAPSRRRRPVGFAAPLSAA